MKKVMTVLAVLAIASVAAAQEFDYANFNSGVPTGAEITYTIPGVEGGANVLVFNDRPVGHGGVATAGMELAAAGFGTVTFTNTSAAFDGLLTSGSWDIVLSGNHNFLATSHDASLSAYVNGGGRAVVEDWRTGGEPGYTFGTVSAPTNYASATGTDRLADIGTVPLGNSGWGVFAVTVASPGGTQQLLSAFGGNAGVSNGFGGGDKNLFLSGLNDDTIGWVGTGSWDAALATDLYTAMINNTPEPTTLALLGLGALGILRRRR
jgi:hypothetical protein